MRSCVLLLLLLLIPGMALCSAISDGMNKCSQAGVPPAVRPGMTVAEIDQAFDVARRQKLQQCVEADLAIKAYEQKAKALDDAVAHRDEAAHAATTRADSAIGTKLEILSDLRAQLWGLPNDPSDTNNRLFRDKLELFASFGKQTQELSKRWDLIFAPVVGSPFDILIKDSADDEFPSDLRQSIADSLLNVPAYLLGKGPAPRQKLNFLFEQSSLTRWSIELKKRYYAKPIVERADQSLQEDLGQAVADTRARAVRTALLSRFSYHDVAWAKLAVASGACSFARDALADQIEALKEVVEGSTGQTETVSRAIQSDLSERQAALSSIVCDSSRDVPLLRVSLSRWVRILPSLCANKAPDIDATLGLFISDARNFSKEKNSLIDPNDADLENIIAQKMWDDGFDLATRICGGVAK